MKVNLFKIECLTNMHVGSGDVNYNIVDNEVERDPVLGTPTIHSSGIKGALRSHFEGKVTYKDKIIGIFGSEQKKSKDAASSVVGTYKFLNANIIARPLRVSEGTISYANVTTVEIVNNIINLLLGLGVKKLYGEDLKEIKCDVTSNSFVSFTTSPTLSMIEGRQVTTITDENENIKALLDKLIGGNYAITTKDDLNSFDLPVMARNQLEKGSSKNLWYEEIVPHKSIFFFVILTPDKCELEFDGETVQFGGNASIGYGYTKVTKVGVENE